MENHDTAATKPIVLIVDDTPDNLRLMSEILKDFYRVKVANSGEKALRIAAADSPPDLIVLDIMMPVMNGYEVCKKLKADPATRHIPIIFLTAKTHEEDQEYGLTLGAVDYITKPISPPIFLARVRNHLALKAYSDDLERQVEKRTRDLQKVNEELRKRSQEIIEIQDVTILAMASLAETRDSDTGNHIRRTQHYIKELAESLKTHPRFAIELTDERIALLFKCAPLHDIGKVGIADRILFKPGRLTPDEFAIMMTHPKLGRDAIEQAEQQLGRRVDFLTVAKEIAYYHHEKWDGSGYPEGLAGERIPLSARLMAVADVYDALIGRRVYKEPMPHEKALAIMIAGRGTHFDPDILDAFVAHHERFRDIAARFDDDEGSIASKKTLLEAAGRLIDAA